MEKLIKALLMFLILTPFNIYAKNCFKDAQKTIKEINPWAKNVMIKVVNDYSNASFRTNVVGVSAYVASMFWKQTAKGPISERSTYFIKVFR
jgi:hypothetical protein